MNSPTVGPRRLVYENRIQRVCHVAAHFDGYTKEYFVTEFGARAGIVVLKEDSVLLVRQFRLLLNDLSWEIPGGAVEEGETPVDAAMRECAEETGVHCRHPKLLLTYHPGLDVLYNPTSIYYAHDCTESSHGEENLHEMVQHVWVPLQRCLEMISDREIVDGLSIIALLSYQQQVSSGSS